MSSIVYRERAKTRLAQSPSRRWCSHWALCCSSTGHASICPGYILDSPPQLTLIEGIRETASSLKYPPTLSPPSPPSPPRSLSTFRLCLLQPLQIDLHVCHRLDHLYYERIITVVRCPVHRRDASDTSEIPPLSIYTLIKRDLHGSGHERSRRQHVGDARVESITIHNSAESYTSLLLFNKIVIYYKCIIDIYYKLLPLFNKIIINDFYSRERIKIK